MKNIIKPILDFHTHAFPDHLASHALRQMCIGLEGIQTYTDGTVNDLKCSMRRAGVSHSVVLNIVVKPGQFTKTNDFARTMLSAPNQSHESCRLIPFASIHPFDPQWQIQLETLAKEGFVGIKFHPGFQRFQVDDPAIEPVYAAIHNLGLVTIFHGGIDIGMPEIDYASPRRFANILSILEKGTTIIAHMGGADETADTLKLLAGRDIYFDTSFGINYMDATAAKKFILRHDPSRLLFGSDVPWDSQRDALIRQQAFFSGYLSQVDCDGIFFQNGAALLGLQKQCGACL